MSAQKRTPSGVLGGFLAFVGMSVAAGVLVTAAVTPAIAVTGMAATSGINMFENLPGYLEIGDLAQKTNIYATQSDGTPVPARLVLRPEPRRGHLGEHLAVREGRRRRR